MGERGERSRSSASRGRPSFKVEVLNFMNQGKLGPLEFVPRLRMSSPRSVATIIGWRLKSRRQASARTSGCVFSKRTRSSTIDAVRPWLLSTQGERRRRFVAN
jgi:hypothetical protein